MLKINAPTENARLLISSFWSCQDFRTLSPLLAAVEMAHLDTLQVLLDAAWKTHVPRVTFDGVPNERSIHSLDRTSQTTPLYVPGPSKVPYKIGHDLKKNTGTCTHFPRYFETPGRFDPTESHKYLVHFGFRHVTCAGQSIHEISQVSGSSWGQERTLSLFPSQTLHVCICIITSSHKTGCLLELRGVYDPLTGRD